MSKVVLGQFLRPAARSPHALCGFEACARSPRPTSAPADEATRQRLYDEMDFQRASQAYIWGLPIVSFAQWQFSAHTDLGAGDTDMVIYESVKDKFGILTANATTPYIGGFPDLSKTGPLVIDYPAG